MKKLLTFLLTATAFSSHAQDLAFGRKMVDTLTSPYFWGRGYTNNGMQKAADFLAAQFKSYGLQPLSGSDFYQRYSYSANSFPGKMVVSINGKELVPGKDFIVSPESSGIEADGKLVKVDSNQFVNKKNKLIVVTQHKLTWSASQEAAGYTVIEVDKKALTGEPEKFEADIENKLIPEFKTANICGYVKGISKPDSFIFITAHYDHLGGMGKDTYFPGANDNASGTALLLNLAHYYAQHPQPYSIAFICFSGEEIGLLGSAYYTEHPLIPLNKIRFLLNTDLAGNGDDGITIVNATEFPEEFEWMKEINNSDKLLPNIYSRGKAKNSDHYHFTEKGVPCFFFYTQGGISAYHDVYDRPETLPLKQHESLFKLVVRFNEKIMGMN